MFNILLWGVEIDWCVILEANPTVYAQKHDCEARIQD